MNIPSSIYWVATWSLYKREVRRFLKVIFQTLATPVITTGLYLLIFGASIGSQIQNIGDQPYIAFIIPGLVMMATLRNTFDNATGSIVAAKYCGEMEDLKISPFSPAQIAWAHGLGSLTRGLLVGLTSLAIGAISYRVVLEEWLIIQHPVLLIIYLCLGGLAFAHLGLSVSMHAKSFDQISGLNTFLLLPLIYLGGVFFSLEHLHPFWQKVSQANPILYLVNGVRYAILGEADIPMNISMAVTVGTALVFYLTALRALKKGNYHRW